MWNLCSLRPGVIPLLHPEGSLWPGWTGLLQESPGPGFAKAAWKMIPQRECGSSTPLSEVRACAAGASAQMILGFQVWSLRREDPSFFTNSTVPWSHFVPVGPGGKLASYLGSYLFHVSIDTCPGCGRREADWCLCWAQVWIRTFSQHLNSLGFYYYDDCIICPLNQDTLERLWLINSMLP